MSQLNSTTDRQSSPASTAQPRHRRDMSLRLRLTLLIFAITVPVLIAVGLLVTTVAGNNLEQDANAQLANINHTLASNVTTWLDLNTKALKQLVSLPDIISMNAERQKPILTAMAGAYPDMYLVSTTDLTGYNVARSDDVAPKDYSSREWFQGAKAGSLTFQSLIGATSNKPALVAAMPISSAGVITGVGMFASELTVIRTEVNASRIGQTGDAYVIDDKDVAVAFTDPTMPITQLNKLESFPQVSALRQGIRGQYDFTDQNGVAQRAYLDVLPNGWGIIVQQQRDELLSSLQLFRQLAIAIVVIGLIILVVLAWFIIRRALRPIGALTETATAITAGDLSRAAPIEREDEIGLLARAFNMMTTRLRELIDSLETRVEMRTAQIQAGADVGRAATSILNTDQLLKQIAALITERFGFYYAGVFTLDSTGRWAVLREASGPGDTGLVLKEAGHKLEVGGKSMVSTAIVKRAPHIALDVGAEPVRFVNPLLPDTRSEIALPLIVGTRVLGALDVQSTQPAAFDQTSATVLQAMADQIATALNNAAQYQHEQTRAEQITSLLEASIELTAQHDEQALYDRIIQLALSLLKADGAALWLPTDNGLIELKYTLNAWPREMLGLQLNPGQGLAGRVYANGLTLRTDNYETWAGRSADIGNVTLHAVLGAPLLWQNKVIGVLAVTHSESGHVFTADDENLAQVLAAQAATALESLRLRQEQQRTVEELNTLTRRLTREAWQTGTLGEALTYEYRPFGSAPIESTGLSLQIPIEVHGEPIGAITIEDERRRELSDDERSLIQGVVQQMALALENQRLADIAQRTAQREKQIAQAADKIHRAGDMESILRTAVEEVSRIVGVEEVGIQLGIDRPKPNGNGGQSAPSDVERLPTADNVALAPP